MENTKSLWVAPVHKELPKQLYLFNKKPQLAEKSISEFTRENDIFYSDHGLIHINKEYWSMFDGMEFPVAVELVETIDEKPMYYIQKYADKKGFNHTHISTHISTISSYHFGIKKIEEIVDSGGYWRLPMWVFPDLKPNKIIKANIKIK